MSQIKRKILVTADARQADVEVIILGLDKELERVALLARYAVQQLVAIFVPAVRDPGVVPVTPYMTELECALARDVAAGMIVSARGFAVWHLTPFDVLEALRHHLDQVTWVSGESAGRFVAVGEW